MSRPAPTGRPLRLLHASDCHLGSHRGPGAHEAAFAALVDAAERWSVDALLLAGDVFDHARVPDEVLRWTRTQLGRLDVPTVIGPGNHDAWGPASVYRRLDLEAACPRVRLLRQPAGETVHLDELGLTVWGRPVVDHQPSFRPLRGVPERPAAGWCVVMGHGLVLDSDQPTDRGSPIYPDDLAAVDWDYVALGHWPTHWLVRSGTSPVCYAGPTSAHFGWPDGAVLVDLCPGAEPQIRRLPLGGAVPGAERPG